MYSEAHDCVYLYRPAYVLRTFTWYYDVSSWTSDLKCTFPKGSYMDCMKGESEFSNGLFCDQANDPECQACRDLCDGDDGCGGFNLYPYEPFYANPLRLINDPGVNASDPESTITNLRLCRFLKSHASGQIPQPWLKGVVYWYQEKYDATNYELHVKDGEISIAQDKQRLGGGYISASSGADESKKSAWIDKYDENHFADHCVLADCSNTNKWPDSIFHSSYTKPCDYIDKFEAIPIQLCQAGGDFHDVCSQFLDAFENTPEEETRAMPEQLSGSSISSSGLSEGYA